MRKSNTAKPRHASLLATTILLIFCLGSACGARTASETLSELRRRLETDPAPSVTARVDACIDLLQQEMQDPSTPTFGIGGGPIDSGYLQGVIMGSVCTFAERGQKTEIHAALAAKLAEVPASDSQMRDRFNIMLGTTADKSVIPQLIAILETHKEGFMRFNAACALREMDDCADAIPALQRALQSDNYARVRFSHDRDTYDSRTMVYSPVRSIAAEILARNKLPISPYADVVEAKYAVQRLEPLLYLDAEGRHAAGAAVEALGMIGGPDALAALDAFVAKRGSTNETDAVVKLARATSTRLRAAK